MVSLNIAGLTLALIVLLALSQTATCIKCYSCSPVEGKCEDPFDKTANKEVDCDQKLFDACIKSGPTKSILRSCAKAGICGSAPNCHECKTDLCNSSTSIMPSLLVTSFAAFIVAKYYL